MMFLISRNPFQHSPLFQKSSKCLYVPIPQCINASQVPLEMNYGNYYLIHFPWWYRILIHGNLALLKSKSSRYKKNVSSILASETLYSISHLTVSKAFFSATLILQPIMIIVLIKILVVKCYCLAFFWEFCHPHCIGQ